MSDEQRSEREARLQRAADLSERIAERCQTLLQGFERANELQRELDALATEISESMEQLRAAMADSAAPRRGSANLDTVRLIALQMKLAGRSRSQVHDHLRGTLGIDKPEAVLDDVFGAGARSS